MNKKNSVTVFAILAAAFYAVNVSLSKILMLNIEPAMMAVFLYPGAEVEGGA